MARHLLFFVDKPGGTHPFDWTWIGKWCGLYGIHPVVIDVAGEYRPKDHAPYHFRSLEEATAHPDFHGHAWVWLDPRAAHYWDEQELPKEDVIFCLGHDQHGFSGFEWEGQRVKVRSPHPDKEGEWYAAMVVPLLLCEVYGK